MADLLHRKEPGTTEVAPARVPESEEVREHHRQVVGAARRAGTRVRWLAWMAAVVLVGLIVAATLVVMRDDAADTDVVVDWPTVPVRGPGSNSFDAVTVTQAWPEIPVRGPGSNSFGAVTVTQAWPEIPAEGPGSVGLG